jgi:hypothetical protein
MMSPHRPSGETLAVQDYCTIADVKYLTRVLTLHGSLRRSTPAFRLFVLCIDDTTLSALSALHLPGLHPLSAGDLESADPEMRLIRQGRTQKEYCCACKPFLLLYIMSAFPGVSTLIYVDADMFFFGDANAIDRELGEASVLVTEHGYQPGDPRRTAFGQFNAGVIAVRRTPSALECIGWWKARCIEWCYDKIDLGLFLDQKYLDEWPDRFEGVKVCAHPGINVAHWNVTQTLNPDEMVSISSLRRVHRRSGTLFVDDSPLVCYHFCGVRVIWSCLFYTCTHRQPGDVRRNIQRGVYLPYLKEMRRWIIRLAGHIPHPEYPCSVWGIVSLAAQGGIVFVRPPFEAEIHLPRTHKVVKVMREVLKPLRRTSP